MYEKYRKRGKEERYSERKNRMKVEKTKKGKRTKEVSHTVREKGNVLT